ncbi:MAG: diphthine--ammonia ligase [Candidatus Diapherotrites archaeon]|nr:diphthine--ammonia ligase [Candidatus Diapherotrites archaeon]
MCGIIGVVNLEDTVVEKGLEIMASRGADASKITKLEHITFGHNLHSIIDYVEQPLVSAKGMLVINCEIYNWEELRDKYKLKAKNDAELVLKLIELKGMKKIVNVVEELDGDFAFAYFSKKANKIILAKDLAGVKPLAFSINTKEGKFAFATEKKALPFKSTHINPRKITIYDIKTKKIKNIDRWIDKKKVLDKNEIKDLLELAVKKRIPKKELALLLSGGVDSALIGKILQNNKMKFNSYFAGIKDLTEPKDLAFAKGVAKELGTKLNVNLVTVEEFEKELPKIISLIESTDPVRVGVASTIYFATKKVKEKVVLSGLGADELFAGYNRFKNSTQVNKDCYSYFIKMYENDLYFEDIITMSNKVELRVPYLDKKLVEKALRLNPKYKIDTEKDINKIILREYAQELGLGNEFSYRPKKAAQYGSNFDKALEKLAKKNNFSSKAKYLNSLTSEKNNTPVAALISTGKDSLYAMHLMQKQGYNVKCLITIDSENKDSFMFHTPTIEFAKLQAKALDIPLIIVKTKGEKEEELKDLEKAISQAKKEFGIEGICSGALYSNYQRSRIENICESVGIRAFAPLWQMNQLDYLKQVMKEGFDVIITKIACYKLDEGWLGSTIDGNTISKLKKLEEDVGVNPAGEGGEYETLVLDMPTFKQKIRIEKSEKKMENEFTGELIIKKSKLVKK